MKALLKSLKSRHEILDARISAEQRQPLPDDLRIRAMKKLKLKLKEQIAILERSDEGANFSFVRSPQMAPRMLWSR